MTHYILDEGGEVREVELDEWARWFETAQRHVANDEIAPGIRVSTVFLGIDHSFRRAGPPVLWETMIFGFPADHPLADYQERYTSKAEAIFGHDKAIIEAKGYLDHVAP